MRISSSDLRRDLSQRNIDLAEEFEHELSYGTVPSVVYSQQEDGTHGNFHPASYRAICARPEWAARLNKSYTGSRWITRSWLRIRRELDCATSSDALLMNIFCYPRLLHRLRLCTLLGIAPGLEPEFGVRPHIPLERGLVDRTEVDMRLGKLLVEAKLTETGFQSAPVRLLHRYSELEQVFELADLPLTEDKVHSWQLIRSVLAAHATNGSFLLLLDGRRSDLIEQWFKVLSAVHSYSFRSRLKLATWQELALTLPPSLAKFLDQKYGIGPDHRKCSPR
jgi:hypothetical protein